MEAKALQLLAEGFSFYDTSVKLGVTPQEVEDIYMKNRANPK